MRLHRLTLDHYGSFQHAELEFAVEPGRLNLVLAPNGAGKSVLRQAFHDLLFDIPRQSPMQFRHGYAGMAVQAEAVGADGAPFDFAWVRGAKPQRRSSDPARFDALMRDVTPQQLQLLFALDTAGLRKGGTDLKGGTSLAAAMLAGTGELASAKAVRAALDGRAQANWGPRKSTPPLNAALAAVEAARKAARAAIQRPQQREAAEAGAADRRAAHAAARQALAAARAATQRLNRIALARPHLQALAEAEAWLHDNADAPALPPGLDERLAAARSGKATAEATQRGAAAQLDEATAARDRIARDPAASLHAEALARLHLQLGEAEKTALDLGARRDEALQAAGTIAALQRELGTAVPPDAVAGLIPPTALVAELRGAITRHAVLQQAAEQAALQQARAAQELATATAEPAAAPTVPDGLPALLQEIRADRNPAQHAAELAEAAAAADATLAAALAQVPGWRGGAEALRALAPPAEPAFERLDAARRDAATARAAADRARDALRAEDAQARQALDTLRRQPIPDEEAVAAARALRDRGMRLVLRRAFMPETADSAAERAHAGEEPLALVHERQVRAADELADRRAAELDRVHAAGELASRLAELAPLLEAALQAAAAAASVQAAASRAWADAVAPLGLPAEASMAELRLVCAGRTRVIEAMRAQDVARQAARQAAARHQEWAGRLGALLGTGAAPLPALLARADALLAAVQLADRALARQQARLTTARRGESEAATARRTAETALQHWATSWSTLLARLGRPPGEPPQATESVLATLAELDAAQRSAESLRQRILAMQDDLDGFAADVAALARALDEPEQHDPAATARLLIARAARAAQADGARAQAEENHARAVAAAATARTGLEAASSALDAAVAAAGARTPEEADRRIAAAREHTRQSARREAALAGLHEHGDGLARAALQAETQSVPPELMVAARAEAAAAESAAAEAAETAAIALQQAVAALDEDAATTAAIDRQAEFQAAAAQLGRRLEEQLVLQVAGLLLQRAMHSVEASTGGDTLARLTAQFAAVTGGAYGVVAEDGPEGEVLYAVEHAFPAERKTLDQLSEGTRDQLYLALRMLALREHCAASTPLPFIADDILQTFDDDRARAALRALLELSAELQVIVLTHHPHLAEIAASLGEERARIVRL